jgi:hypothetical protein
MTSGRVSFVPPQRGQDVLCALVRVPTADDLRVIELETLIATDFWQRVHIC